MEADLVQGPVGSVGKYDLAFKEGKLVAELSAEAGPVSGGIVVKLDAGKVIDAIEKAIPGQLDDAILEMLKSALLK